MTARRSLRLLLALFLLIPALTIHHPAQAQQEQLPGIRVVVSPLFEGIVRPGGWLPLRVRLENDGPDMTVRVSAAFRRSGGNDEVFVRAVELPAGSRKETTLYVRPNPFSRSVLVTVEGVGGKVEHRVPLHVLQTPTLVLGIVSSTGTVPETFGRWGNTKSGANVRTLSVAPEELPVYPAVWNLFDAIVLSDVDADVRLTPEQQRALAWWVSQGGMLLVGGGMTPTARRNVEILPDALRPVTVVGDASLSALPALAAWVEEPIRVSGPFAVAVGEPLPGSSVLVEQEGYPLLVRRTVHQGDVVWLALHPAQSPFDAWAGADDLWERLLGSRTTTQTPGLNRQAIEDYRINQIAWALNNLPSLNLPSLKLLALLFLLYIVTVGPLNYILLRRKRRLEWAWGTIPAITVMFALLTFGVGWSVRGNEVVLHVISTLEVMPDAGVTARHAYVGLFSPRRTAYRVTFDEPVLVSLASTVFQPWDVPIREETNVSPEATVIRQGAPTVVERLSVNQWAMQHLAAEYSVEEGAPLTATLQFDGTQVRGTVWNRTDFPVQNVALILPNKVSRLGDVPANSQLPVKVTVNEPTLLPIWEPISVQLFPYTGESDRENERRRQVVSAFLESPKGTARQPLVLLVGWSENIPLAGIRVDNVPFDVYHTIFYLVSLSPRFGATIPPILPITEIKAGTDAWCYTGSTIGVAPVFDQAEIVFELPSDVPPSVNQLLLLAQQQGGWNNPPQLKVWNNATASWEPVDRLVWGLNTIPVAGRELVGPDRRVRFLVERPSQPGGGPCFFFFLGVEAGEEP